MNYPLVISRLLDNEFRSLMKLQILNFIKYRKNIEVEQNLL